MDNWRNLILVSDTQKQDLTREAQNARMIRDMGGTRRASGWLLRFVALTIIFLGVVAVWAH